MQIEWSVFIHLIVCNLQLNENDSLKETNYAPFLQDAIQVSGVPRMCL